MRLLVLEPFNINEVLYPQKVLAEDLLKVFLQILLLKDLVEDGRVQRNFWRNDDLELRDAERLRDVHGEVVGV